MKIKGLLYITPFILMLLFLAYIDNNIASLFISFSITCYLGILFVKGISILYGDKCGQ
jgi:hypothetical protein